MVNINNHNNLKYSLPLFYETKIIPKLIKRGFLMLTLFLSISRSIVFDRRCLSLLFDWVF